MRVDYLVVGAGPAGLQLGWFLQRAGRDYSILESGSTPGTFFRTFPRHRRMISINKPHTGWDDPERNLRMDWNSLLSDDPGLRFTRYTDRYFPVADDYVRYLVDFAAGCELNVEYDTRVTRIARSRDRGGDFTVTDQHGRTLRAERVIVATGLGRPFVPPIPGIEATERYGEVSVDPDDFIDQRVLVIGKGNSAFEVANSLVERAAVIHVLGPRSIVFAWRTHFIGHLRAVNNDFLDTYQLKAQNMVLDATIRRIERAGSEFVVTLGYSRRDKTVELAYDRVITCTGFRMDTSIFDESCRPDLTIDDRFPALTSEWESVNVPDLYFAGTLTQSRDFKRHNSAFIHGFRYCVRSLQRMLDRKHEGGGWPHRELPAEPTALTDAVLARVNRSSALWQQYGFRCDLIEVSPDTSNADLCRYYHEVPVDHVLDGGFGVTARSFMVTLEYGAGHDTIDPFDVDVGRAWEADPAHEEDRYLHPVIRYYEADRLVSVLHLPEDVYNDWSGETGFRTPLRDFFARAIEHTTPPGTTRVRGAGSLGGRVAQPRAGRAGELHGLGRAPPAAVPTALRRRCPAGKRSGRRRGRERRSSRLAGHACVGRGQPGRFGGCLRVVRAP
jgi:thioredoxin reductase